MEVPRHRLSVRQKLNEKNKYEQRAVSFQVQS